jgi:nicotinate-nucleotide pyrophosphorylase (carboxylating)
VNSCYHGFGDASEWSEYILQDLICPLTIYEEKLIIFSMTPEIDTIIEAALKEDMPDGDVTSESLVPSESVSKAIFLAKEDGILAGIDVAARVFWKIDPHVAFAKNVEDGSSIRAGDTLARIEGPSVSLLKGERTALNFLQRMCGIATLTQRFVQGLEGSQTQILDTRKTTPSLRSLEKYAVKMGGGTNHRLSLSDMVLIKDNHLKIVGNISKAVKKARDKVGPDMKIEVETTTLEEVKEAVCSGADMILLDNMSPERMREAVEWVNGRIPIEASGNVKLSTLKEVASSGVDFISVGSLTHSYQSLDISMEFL